MHLPHYIFQPALFRLLDSSKTTRSHIHPHPHPNSSYTFKTQIKTRPQSPTYTKLTTLPLSHPFPLLTCLRARVYIPSRAFFCEDTLARGGIA